MKFVNVDKTLSEGEVAEVERKLGLQFPQPLKHLFLHFNGGEPQPYVLERTDIHIDTVVSVTLPLRSESGRRTASDEYRNLILDQELAPTNFFPFAVDGGGDYFLVDCNSDHGRVFFLDSARYPPIELKDLGVGLDQFWTELQSEDEE